ncbi:MAG: apolipoprotein N-acyltransferase [Bacteroidetes bacterium]|nr:MAG: apolipoprotein N-acyltransferase [Bacteroidota bacterium]
MLAQKRIHPLILSLLSGLLLYASWPVSPLTFLIFVAFVPLLLMEEQGIKRGPYFGYVYLSLLIWNTGTTWWMCNSTVPGGIAAILANSLLMCIPWIGFYNIKKRIGARVGYISLVVFWMTFEYIHLNWELSWPWLTLGNVFAMRPGWIQWYEFTGAGGGTLWILVLNIIFFLALQKKKYALLSAASTLILPVVISLVISYQSKVQEGDFSNIVIVQPNIDPYDEKFVAGKQEAQIIKLIRLSEAKIDSNTKLVVWPETAIPVAIDEDSMKTSYFMQPVWDFLRAHPNLNLLTGIEGFRLFTEQTKNELSQKLPESNSYFDSYNSAALMDGHNFQIYHKSRLVPGVEVLPSFLRFMAAWFEKFGGTTGGYTGQRDRTVLKTYNGTYRIAPAVCYESIYGEFMAKYIRNGANTIIVITNDGWWGNTAGYKQHKNYARLRAIENRRWVARSANTGISCFVDPFGNVIDPQDWDKTASIKLTVPALSNQSLTFYTIHGDYIFRSAVWITLLIVIWDLFLIIKKRFHRA